MESVGKKIRALRKKKGLSLQDLASKLNLSVSYLSQLENGRTNISVALLKDIADILEVSSVFFLLEEQTKPLVKVIRKSERSEYVRNNEKVTINVLFATENEKLQSSIINIPPGLDSGKSSCHYGDEFTYVIEGELEVLLNETEVYRLSTGDVIYYPSHIPHKWKNVGETMARVLSTGTPASF
ncbi:MAG: helix-turn-helix domain-containing protein [Zhaonellaceae bacterium]